MAIVYAAKSDNDPRWKIGRTKAKDKRLKAHRGSNPSFTNYKECETDSPGKIEALLHNLLASKRALGTTEWFDCGDDEIESAFAEAEDYRDNVLPLKKSVDKLKDQDSGNDFLPPDQGARHKYDQLKAIREELSRLRYKQERLQLEIMDHIGVHKGIGGLFSWESHSKTCFDQTRFERERPDLYAQYRDKITTERRFVLL